MNLDALQVRLAELHRSGFERRQLASALRFVADELTVTLGDAADIEAIKAQAIACGCDPERVARVCDEVRMAGRGAPSKLLILQVRGRAHECVVPELVDIDARLSLGEVNDHGRR